MSPRSVNFLYSNKYSMAIRIYTVITVIYHTYSIEESTRRYACTLNKRFSHRNLYYVCLFYLIHIILMRNATEVI